MAVAVLIGNLDVNGSRNKSALAHFFRFELNRQSQRVQTLTNGLNIHAGVKKSCQRHVSTDAAEAIEVNRMHGGFPSNRIHCRGA